MWTLAWPQATHGEAAGVGHCRAADWRNTNRPARSVPAARFECGRYCNRSATPCQLAAARFAVPGPDFQLGSDASSPFWKDSPDAFEVEACGLRGCPDSRGSPRQAAFPKTPIQRTSQGRSLFIAWLGQAHRDRIRGLASAALANRDGASICVACGTAIGAGFTGSSLAGNYWQARGIFPLEDGSE